MRRTKKEEEEKHERDTQRKREDNKEKKKEIVLLGFSSLGELPSLPHDFSNIFFIKFIVFAASDSLIFQPPNQTNFIH